MKHLLVFLLLLCSASVSAQDVIVKKDGSTVVCRVVEVTATEITYKKWSNLNGSSYVMDKSLASSINYESGKKETFGSTESLYKPNNQNDGTQQYNDRALLAIAKASYSTPQQAKTLRLIGWIGGLALIGGGVAFASSDDDNTGAGLAIAGGGVLFTAGFLLAASHQTRKARSAISKTEILKNDFKFANGCTLSASIDMLRDHDMNSNALGLGVRYNF